jgi:RNA polymerase sigma-70 factor (ECF subfamily)
MDTDVSDEELMLRYREGEAPAFEALYRRHRAPLFRYFLRQCDDRASAEELFQETWTALIRARGTYAATARFTTYLYRLAHNRLMDHYRGLRRAPPLSYSDNPAPLESVPAGSEQQPERRLESEREHERLLGLIASLPEAQREVFLLRQHTGLSLEEIAGVVGVNAETAKSRLRYALVKLRDGMEVPA